MWWNAKWSWNISNCDRFIASLPLNVSLQLQINNISVFILEFSKEEQSEEKKIEENIKQHINASILTAQAFTDTLTRQKAQASEEKKMLEKCQESVRFDARQIKMCVSIW